jgi:hypothetical protein
MYSTTASKTFADEIDDVIEKNIATYKIDPDRIISDYRGEKGLTEAYNGRQLLELLQNADDAKTDKVLITLDTTKRLLSIANNGDAFDIKGVKSLMLANTSSKNKREFIGNKGLGFRSILNWVTKVSIKTKGTTLIFSPKIAKYWFEKVVQDASSRNRLIANEKDLTSGTVPFAVLAIPKVEENDSANQWTTIIEVEYKDDPEIERHIKKQLGEIRPEILLFLNHTETVTITGAGELDKTLKLEKPVENGEQFLEVNKIRWQLYDSGEQVLNAATEKYYRYKIAWKNGLSDVDTRFFTYFPTQVATRLPYLIHATFDLDPTRNHLNVSEDNTFILSQIAKTLGELAITKLQTKGEVNWKAFQFLSPIGQSDNEILKPFYTSLQHFRNSLSVYPSIDGDYYAMDEVKFYNNQFSSWILSNGFARLFPHLLLPQPLNNLFEDIKVKKYNEDEWYAKVNELSALITLNSLRAELMSMFLQDVFKPHHERYALLVNRDGKVIKADTLVFTPIIQSAREFSKPTYLEFDFINKDLYDLLVTQHKNDFQKGETDAREFQRLFKELVNVQPYDSNNVISRIITGTRRQLARTTTDEHPEVVKEMVQKVFENFPFLKDRAETFNETFPLLNRQNKVRDSDELHINATFPSGKLVETLYEGIFTFEAYVQDISYWELGSNDHAFIELFFIWMGVNKYVKFEVESFEIKHWENNAYKNYAIKKIKVPEKVTYYKFQGLKIDKIDETLGKLNIEKLIVLIRKEEKIFSRLGFVNPDKFYHTYGNAYFQEFTEKPSYIRFQLNKLINLNNYIIEENDIPFIQSFSLESHKSSLKKYDVSDDDVKYILAKLGAKSTFLEFGLSRVFNLLNECAKQKGDASVAAKLYKLAFNNFRKRNDEVFETYHFDLQLLAIKNGQKEYRHVDEVYYSDNTTLPSKIIHDYWMFYFPKRSGEKQIADYFGVKTFKDIKINIVEGSIAANGSLAVDFCRWIEKIKPYLLTYRLNTLKSESVEKNAVALIKNMQVQVVTQAKYYVDDKDAKELMPGEFLNPENNKFILCAPGNATITTLKDDPAFCEAFAEVLCVLFEVNEGKDDYRAVFKDREDLKDTQYLIRAKSLEDKLSTAIKLLGLSVEESVFWNTIFKLCSIAVTELVTSREVLGSLLKQVNFKLPDNYGKVHFDSFDNKESVEFLKSVCDSIPVSLQQLKAAIPDFPGLKNWHINQINNKLIDVSSLYMKAVWASLKDKDMDKQRQFSQQKEAFSSYCRHLTWDSLDAFVFDLDYIGILIAKVEASFNLNLDNAFAIDPATVIYKSLMDQFNIEEAALTPENQSLLYFEGYNDYFLALFKKHNQADNAGNTSDDELQAGLSDIKFPAITDGIVPAFKPAASSHSTPNNDHSKRNKQQKRAGKRAELLTRNILKNGYDIKWISANSDQADVIKNDAAGYDMEYKEKGTEEWFFLEVKSVSSHSFIISLNEIKVALKEKEKYHLGLVKNGELNIIKDFFIDEGRISKFNELLSYGAIRPIDFEVYFDLKPSTTDAETGYPEIEPREIIESL